jgi:hypothetical protein
MARLYDCKIYEMLPAIYAWLAKAAAQNHTAKTKSRMSHFLWITKLKTLLRRIRTPPMADLAQIDD